MGLKGYTLSFGDPKFVEETGEILVPMKFEGGPLAASFFSGTGGEGVKNTVEAAKKHVKKKMRRRLKKLGINIDTWKCTALNPYGGYLKLAPKGKFTYLYE
jgi:hypothetical protein